MMKRLCMAMAFLFVLSTILMLFGAVALAAHDEQAPVLIDAFPVKGNFSSGESLDYILIFNEPGGIDLAHTGAHFQLDGSPTPASTEAYTGWINSTVLTNATEDYRNQYPGISGLYALKISIPIHDFPRDNFMTGTYRLDSVCATDNTGNWIIYGCTTNWWGAFGLDLPQAHDLSFMVANSTVSLIAPTVEFLQIDPAHIEAGSTTATITLRLKDADGIDANSVSMTFWADNPRMPDGFYQYYLPNAWISSGLDEEGITTLTQSLVLPDIPPGQYSIQQFHVADTLGNDNYRQNAYEIYPNLDQIGFELINEDYVYPTAPSIDEFLQSAQTAQPGDTVDFQVRFEENSTEIEDIADLRIITEAGINIDVINLSKNEQGFYCGSYQIPADLVPQKLSFGLAVSFKNYTSAYQIDLGEYGPGPLHPVIKINSVFDGLKDISILVGTSPEELQEALRNGVTASNTLMGDMTSQITIEALPNLSKTGVYLVRYEVPQDRISRTLISGEPFYPNYIGYRWVGVTDILPDDASDPFVVTNESLNIGGATQSDVSVEADYGDGFTAQSFSTSYTQPGDYRLTKTDFEEPSGDLSRARFLSSYTRPSNSRELLCRVEGFHVDSYTVSFDSQGGSAVVDISADNGSTVDEPTEPTLTGYDFSGWFDAATGGNKITFPYTVTGNVTLYAHWAIQTYGVTFDSQGGSAVGSKSAQYHATVTAPTEPTLTGYDFSGWFDTATGGNKISFPYTVTGNTTLYAHWAIQTYGVAFDSQGGTAVGGKSAQYHATVTAPTEPTRIGFTFGGWYKDKACTSIWDFSIDRVTADTTLYARWNINSYTVHFDAQGGSGPADTSVPFGSKLNIPVMPVRSTFDFTGWYKDAARTILWDFDTDTVADNVILYAGWAAQTQAPTLNGFGLSAGRLTRGFSPKTTGYTVQLSENEGSVTVTPDLTYDLSAMTIDGKKIAAKTVSLANGKSATMTIKVTLGKKSTTYKLKIQRAKSTASALAALNASAGTWSSAFDPNVTSYALALPENVAKVTLIATRASVLSKVTPAKASYTLKNGQTVKAAFKVKAQSGATRTYTVMITRAKSTNANLSSLKSSAKGMAPGFNPAVMDYSVVLPAKTGSTTLTVKAADKLSRVTINGTKKTSLAVKLANGASTTVTVTVTAQSGIVKSYRVTINRQ